MVEMKRKKATKDLLAKTRRTKGAKEEMYARMVHGCISALVEREMDIYLTFPYFVKFQKGFPKGVLVEKTELTNIYKVKTRKLLDWLYEKGYSKQNSESVMKATRDFNFNLTWMINQMDRDFGGNDDGADSGFEEQDESNTEAGSD